MTPLMTLIQQARMRAAQIRSPRKAEAAPMPAAALTAAEPEPAGTVEIPAKAATTEPPAPSKAATETTAPDAAAIARACHAAGLADLTTYFIEQKPVSAEALAARIEDATLIRRHVETARKYVPTIGAGLADEFIRNGSTGEEAGRRLLEMMHASQSPEIRNTHGAGIVDAGDATLRGWAAAISKAAGQRVGK